MYSAQLLLLLDSLTTADAAVADQFIRSFPSSIFTLGFAHETAKKGKVPTTTVTPKFVHARASSSLNQASQIGKENEKGKRRDIERVVIVRRVQTSPQNTYTHIHILSFAHSHSRSLGLTVKQHL